MISRRVFAVLTTGVVVLSVTSAVVFAFQILLAAVGDSWAANALLVIGRICLGLLAVHCLLLLGALGLSAMNKPEDPR